MTMRFLCFFCVLFESKYVMICNTQLNDAMQTAVHNRLESFKTISRIVITRSEIDLWNINQVFVKDNSYQVDECTFTQWIKKETEKNEKEKYWGMLIRMICGENPNQ